MPVPNMDEVKALLAGFEPRIRAVIEAAWREWLEYPHKGRLVFLARFRAVFVFDAIARNAMAEFDDDKEIHVKVEKQTVKFLFRKQVFARFKKGNDKGVGSNIETQAVLDFIDPNRTIPGLLPDVMRVEFCYGVDQLGLNLSEIAVVARNRNQRIWAYAIDRSEPTADVVPLPPRTPDHTPPVIFPRKPEAGDDAQDAE
jgi:hypothetical protein